jgi:putative membrane protein
MPMWGWMSGWAWLGMAVMLVALLALVVVSAVAVVRLLGPRDQRGTGDRPAGRSAMEILQERFASGEIDEEEFQRRRALLSG